MLRLEQHQGKIKGSKIGKMEEMCPQSRVWTSGTTAIFVFVHPPYDLSLSSLSRRDVGSEGEYPSFSLRLLLEFQNSRR